MEILTIILLVICILLALTISFNRDDLKWQKKLAKNNLGRAEALENVAGKISGNAFVIQSFVPIKEQVNPREMSDMRIGHGLLCHPEYPYNPSFFELVFTWGEDVCPDAKTLYELKQTHTGVWHLKKSIV